MGSAWPPDDSIFSVDRGDVAFGAILVGGVGVVSYLAAGWVAAAVVGLCVLTFVAALGTAAVAHGHRGLRVLPVTLRLALGFVGRWADITP